MPAPASTTAPRSERSPRGAMIALLAGALAIAFAPIFVRLSQVDPVATAFWRLLLSWPVLWLWMTLERRRTAPPPTTRSDRGRLLAAGLFFAADLGVWHWSIRFTSVANATLLANFAPVFVTLAGFLFLRQRFTSVFLLGMVLALAGAGVLMSRSFSLSREHVTGDALGMLTAVFYAGYILSVSALRERFSVATIMTWCGAVTAVSLLAVALAMHERMLPADGRGWAVLIGLALVTQVGGQSLIAYALAHLPASFSSVALLLQPAGAAVLAWLLLGEPLGPVQALGGAIVLGGVVLARVGSARRGPPVTRPSESAA